MSLSADFACMATPSKEKVMARIVTLYVKDRSVRVANPFIQRLVFKPSDSWTVGRYSFGVDHPVPLTEEQLATLADALALRFEIDGSFDVTVGLEDQSEPTPEAAARRDSFEVYDCCGWEKGQPLSFNQSF